MTLAIKILISAIVGALYFLHQGGFLLPSVEPKDPTQLTEPVT